MGLIIRPAILDCDVLAFYESSRIEALAKRVDKVRRAGSCCGSQKSDHRYGGLLRARRERPRRRRTAEQRDERAPLHSITSSARPSSGSGTVRPSASAVFALMTNSNLVGCTTGRSAGLSPLSIRAT